MLRFVVALQAEARPLVERWRLARDPAVMAFRLYRGGDVALIESGPGKVAAAAAVAYLHLACGGEESAGCPSAWLNVGIAGHGVRPSGEVILAHKIRDLSSGSNWYPPRVFESPLAVDEVVTVERVERHFDAPGAHEMEAAGFFPTACRFATAELVQCVKVISDGPGDVPERLTARQVSDLLAARLEEIEEVAETLRELARESRSPASIAADHDRLVARWRFTVTEKRQLRRLLERWRVLLPEEELTVDALGHCRRGRDVLHHLREELGAVPVEIVR